MFSRACEYALQATIYLAAQPDGKRLRLREISDALDIPPHFLGKILQSLTRHNILASHKGKWGGYLLARSPHEISPYEVVEAIDGPAFLDRCVFGFPQCGDETPCPVHPQWRVAKEIICRMLKDRTIAQLSRELDAKLDFDRKLRRRTAGRRTPAKGD